MIAPDTTTVRSTVSATVKLPAAASTAALIAAETAITPQGAHLGSVPPPRAGPRGLVAAELSIYWTFVRPMIARAIMLTTRVIANSTRPEAISVLTAMPDDSGNWSAMLAAIVEGFDWLIRLNVTTPEAERMIATAIVSPSARPRPSIDPLMTADLPNGSTDMRIISQRVAPSAIAPSCRRLGVWVKTSRATAETIGMIITAITRLATSMVRPVAEAGPLKMGMKPGLPPSPCITPTAAGPRTKMPQRP